MGFENSPEMSRVTCKERDDVLEIISQNLENCDDTESYSVDYLFDYIANQKICDITIDIAKISTLELSHCNLTNLSIECKKLNLVHLGLSHNKLTEVPLCLYSGLKHLKYLDLSYNSISHFDMEPECVSYVKTIKLNNNNFENIPKWILMFRCTNLEQFNYSNNKARHYMYLKNSFNFDIIKLKRLELKNNYLMDEDYSFLKCFKYLKYLDISNEGGSIVNKFNELDDLFVKPRWKELSVLKLNSLVLSIFPEGIAWLYSLKELYITDNSLSWLPDSIEFLVNLEVLDISSNCLVAIPRTILSLEKLAVLQASNNNIEVVPDLSQMPSLKTLDLFNNSLDEIPFSHVNFDLIDLEYNYYNTGDIEHFSEYQEKKTNLRRKYEIETLRGDSSKVYYEPPQSPVDTSTEDEDEYYQKDESCCICPPHLDEEDWDVPVKIKNKNPEIDSIDEEWCGEENKHSKFCKTMKKVYVSDDDWMFTDYEES